MLGLDQVMLRGRQSTAAPPARAAAAARRRRVIRARQVERRGGVQGDEHAHDGERERVRVPDRAREGGDAEAARARSGAPAADRSPSAGSARARNANAKFRNPIETKKLCTSGQAKSVATSSARRPAKCSTKSGSASAFMARTRAVKARAAPNRPWPPNTAEPEREQGVRLEEAVEGELGIEVGVRDDVRGGRRDWAGPGTAAARPAAAATRPARTAPARPARSAVRPTGSQARARQAVWLAGEASPASPRGSTEETCWDQPRSRTAG